jgi:AcrR family transcriptional regulator
VGASGFSGTARHADRAAAPDLVLPRVTQRERLLDAMARTVSRRGYSATSVADVLKAARISRRTFYEQFIDKEDCFLAAYDAIAGICRKRFAAAYRSAPSWEAGLARAYDVLLETLAAEPDFARLSVVEALGAGPRAVARRDAALQGFVRFIDEVRDQATLAAAPPALVAQAIAGGIYELVYSCIVRDEVAALPQLSPELLHYTRMLLGIEPSVG